MQAAERKDMLIHAVCQRQRDTMKEARLAGEVEAYETVFEALHRYAQEQLRKAAQ